MGSAATRRASFVPVQFSKELPSNLALSPPHYKLPTESLASATPFATFVENKRVKWY